MKPILKLLHSSTRRAQVFNERIKWVGTSKEGYGKRNMNRKPKPLNPPIPRVEIFNKRIKYVCTSEKGEGKRDIKPIPGSLNPPIPRIEIFLRDNKIRQHTEKCEEFVNVLSKYKNFRFYIKFLCFYQIFWREKIFVLLLVFPQFSVGRHPARRIHLQLSKNKNWI